MGRKKVYWDRTCFQLRMSKEQKARLFVLAEENGVSMNEFLCMSIDREWMAARRPKKKTTS